LSSILQIGVNKPFICWPGRKRKHSA